MDTLTEVRDAAIAALTNGPLPEQQLIDAIASRLNDGRTAGERPSRSRVTELLRLRSDVVDTGDGLTLIQLLVDGTSWSVFVDPDDAAGTTGDGTRADGDPHGIEGGWLRVREHLAPLSWWLVENGAPLVDDGGNDVGTVRTEGIWLDGSDTDVLWSGPGWLDPVAGGWAAVTVQDGTISIAAMPDPPMASEAQLAAIRSAFDAALTDDQTDDRWDEPPPDRRFIGTAQVVQRAVHSNGDAFRDGPIPPIPDLLTGAGLAVDGGLVVEEGFDWNAFRSWQRINRLAMTYGLDRDLAHLAAAATDAMHAALSGDGPIPPLAEQLAEQLIVADITVAVLDEVLKDAPDITSVREILDEAAAAAARRDGRVPSGVAWGQATCAEAVGDPVAADQLLRDAVAGGTDDDLVLVQAATFAADRGEAADAFRLLRQAGVQPYDEDGDRFREGPSEAQALLVEVAEYAHPPRRREVGRNQPCPCGSGRKYKACHQRDVSFTLTERAPWLYEKALRLANRSRGDDIDELADVIASGVPDAAEALRAAPVVADLMLSLDGGWDEFTELRGPLLPTDEQILAAQWALQQPSVFEVVDVERRGRESDGARWALRDIASGDHLWIENVHASGQIQPGTVLYGRPLPVGETYRAFSGFLPVSRARANQLIDAIADGDLFEVAEVLAAEFRPPVLQNSDGDDLEMHEIEWELHIQRDAVAAALTDAGVDADPAESTWTLLGEASQGGDTVIATLRVRETPDGPLSLTAEVNSANRAERIIEIVAAIDPGVGPVRHDITPIDEALADARARFDDSAESEPLPTGAAEAVAEMMARYEEQWIDESIPALGGRTPREAVQDPVGREEVLQLLASFPEPDETANQIGTMNPARIRSLLGLV